MRKKLKFFLVVVILLFVGVFLGMNYVLNSDPGSYFGKRYLDRKYKNESWYKFNNFFDYKGYGFSKPSAKDAMIIDFSDNDLRYNDSVIKLALAKGHFADDLKNWRKTDLIYKKKNYAIQYKFHGTDLFVYGNNRFSLKVKSKKSIDGAKRFNLISGLVEGSFINIFLSQQAYDLNLIGPDPGKILLANVNGKVEDFWYTRDVYEDYIASQFSITKYQIFKNNDNWDRNGFGHFSELAQFYYYIDGENTDAPEDVANYAKYKDFQLDVNQGDLSKIDQEYMGRFLALLYFFYDPHYVYGDNNRLLYDYDKDIVYPVARNEGLYRRVGDVLNFDEGLYVYRGESATQTLYKRAVCNDSIKLLRDQELYKIISNRDKMIGQLDSVYQKSYELHKYYNISFIDLRYNYKKLRKLIGFNCGMIEKYLNNGEVVIAYEKDKDQLTVASDYRVPLKMINSVTAEEHVFRGVGFSFKEGKISTDFIENQILLKSKVRKDQLTFINTVTGDTIPSKSIIFNHF